MKPDLSFELGKITAGLDEVGRGCLAGPVVAAAVILDQENIPAGINDSKKLTQKKRNELYEKIFTSAKAVSIACVVAEEIDNINIRNASLLAMQRAVRCLSIKPEQLLIDGKDLIDSEITQRAVIKGDQISLSIAAASIIAKVTRDRMMEVVAKRHPEYGFAMNVGYGTKQHLTSIVKHNSIEKIHRYSFAPLKSMPLAGLYAKRKAIELLAKGDIVGIPSETVYGLAADATNDKAVQKIYQAKGRPSFNPLITHVSDIVMAEKYCYVNPLARRLAESFWPGPLTMVLPVRKGHKISKYAMAKLDSVALRNPKGIFNQIISEFAKPLVAPSANRSGEISPTSAIAVRESLGDAVPLIIDGGDCDIGVESTIVKVEKNRLIILRYGGLTIEDLQTVAEVYNNEGLKIEAPGMLSSHYAPNAKMRLNTNFVKEGEAYLAFGDTKFKGENVLNLSEKACLREAAHNLFKYMQILDKMHPRAIAVSPIPNIGVGMAINDRLKRAAAPRD